MSVTLQYPLHKSINHSFTYSGSNKKLNKAIKRLKFDEHFFLQLLMALKRQAKEENSGRVFSQRGKYEKDIFE